MLRVQNENSRLAMTPWERGKCLRYRSFLYLIRAFRRTLELWQLARGQVIYLFFRELGKGANIRRLSARRRASKMKRNTDVTGIKMKPGGGKVRERVIKLQGGERGRDSELLPLDFIMQPLKVGVTPIGRKYELRLAEIAWRTLLYLHMTLQ